MVSRDDKKSLSITDKNDNNTIYQYLSNQHNKFRIDHSIIRLVTIIIGGITIYLGYLLFIKGVSGEASLVVNATKLKGQLLNAAPGLFFALAGVTIIVITILRRFDIRIIHKTEKIPDLSMLDGVIKCGKERFKSSDDFNIPTFIRK